MDKVPEKKIVSVNISHFVFSLLFSRDNMAMQASVVCVSCYEFTLSSCAVQYNTHQCFIIQGVPGGMCQTSGGCSL
jgi:hypothetical protein